jgi:hypothetical protein
LAAVTHLQIAWLLSLLLLLLLLHHPGMLLCGCSSAAVVCSFHQSMWPMHQWPQAPHPVMQQNKVRYMFRAEPDPNTSQRADSLFMDWDAEHWQDRSAQARTVYCHFSDAQAAWKRCHAYDAKH